MRCRHCGKKWDEHAYISLLCPLVDDNGKRIGYMNTYFEGQYKSKITEPEKDSK